MQRQTALSVDMEISFYVPVIRSIASISDSLSSDDGNLTVLHCPDPGEKLSSCRRPWADRTMTQNKKGSSVVLCNAPLRSFAVFSHTDFYRAMLCIRCTSHDPVSVCPSVRLSVCPSQVGVLLKWLNRGSHKQHHTIPQGL